MLQRAEAKDFTMPIGRDGIPDLLIQRLQRCPDIQSVLDFALSRSLELTGTELGNVQLMDWSTGYLTIAAQRGFNEDFLRLFRFVKAEDGSACGRAIRKRSPIVIEDLLSDREFAPYRTIALDAGFRAVQSTPLISSGGAFVGVMSTHFPSKHLPADHEMQALSITAELVANAIIRARPRPRTINVASIKEADGERSILPNVGFVTSEQSNEVAYLRQLATRFRRLASNRTNVSADLYALADEVSAKADVIERANSPAGNPKPC
jgi:signal transduction protein with GAF and PtsI domain